jgi:hypothetical protein
MYLLAQRVRARSGQEGINAFFHRHELLARDLASLREMLPEQNPGQLVSQDIQVPPPGNHVRSYLDIVTFEETSNREIVACASRLLLRAIHEPLPWSLVEGACLFQFGLEQALLTRWSEEMAELLRAALKVRGPLSRRPARLRGPAARAPVGPAAAFEDERAARGVERAQSPSTR